MGERSVVVHLKRSDGMDLLPFAFFCCGLLVARPQTIPPQLNSRRCPKVVCPKVPPVVSRVFPNKTRSPQSSAPLPRLFRAPPSLPLDTFPRAPPRRPTSTRTPDTHPETHPRDAPGRAHHRILLRWRMTYRMRARVLVSSMRVAENARFFTRPRKHTQLCLFLTRAATSSGARRGYGCGGGRRTARPRPRRLPPGGSPCPGPASRRPFWR